MSDYRTSCYLCGGSGLSPLKGYPWLVQCPSCSLVYNPSLSFDAKVVSQEVYGQANLAHRWRIRRVLRQVGRMRWNWLMPQLTGKAGSLLEIGAGTGEFLVAARDAGWRVEGLELSDGFRQAAHEWYGIELRGQELSHTSFGCASFDVIALLHVFEHLADPTAFLQHARQLLRPDGWLFIVVPNLHCMTDKLLAGYSATLAKEDHFFHYSSRTLSTMLATGGFAANRIETKEPTHHIWTSTQAYLSSRRAHKAARGATETSPRRLATVRSTLPYIVGDALAIPFAPLRFWLERRNYGHEIFALSLAVH